MVDNAAAPDAGSTVSAWPDEGRLRSFPAATCQNSECRVELTYEGTAAYLHKDRETGKLLTFCGACSQMIQLNHALRFPLIAL